jgi:hypothetical protein
MKNSLHLTCRFALLLLFSIFPTQFLFSMAPSGQEFYQLKIYNFSTQSQEDRLDKFLKDSYLPALHRAGIATVGVFKPVQGENDHGKKIYVLIPFQSMNEFLYLPGLLKKDRRYQRSGRDYIDAPFDNPPYDRIESTLMQAFMDMPKLKVPKHPTPPGERIYEMRSYESATEKLYETKVHMFNQGGELKLFEKLDFNAVFYGEVLSGSTMPNLIYMTSFPSRKVRDEYWGIFRVHPEWEIMKQLEQYQNTVSKNNTFFLYPTDYSGI